ncbi:MAG TPA: carboxypeptidase-like regulatory domain-containing protein [Blastocatellia bacterium]|nr:carboxypeptidase-like regulatory domain-containing protein [Blastocatellia bacterium]
MNQILRHILLLISVTVLTVVAARAQSSPSASKATATISGRVTLDGAGAPGAQVILKPYVSNSVIPSILGDSGVEQPPAPSAVTDAEGRYRLMDVAPGAYRVSVFAPVYMVGGEKDPLTPGKTINVAEGDDVEGVDFALTRGAIITGKVTDEKDRPVIAVPVNVYKPNIYGYRQDNSFSYSLVFRWETDDRGVYRIFGLEPGRYLVAAGSDSAGGGTGGGYRLTYHPDAVDETKARVVEAPSGEEAANIDIKVTPYPKGYVVTGRVVDADSGEPVPGVTVVYTGGFSSATGRPVTNALGEFRFENVAPNSYRAIILNGVSEGRGAPTFGEEIKFEVVDSDVSGLEIRTPRGATISGVVAIEGSNDPALRAKLAQVSLLVQSGSRPTMFSRAPGGNGTISPNGTFKLSNVQPGKTRIITGFDAPKGLALLRAEQNGVEVKEFDVNAGDQITGVRLVFAYGNGVIAGRVEVKGGTLAAGARINVSYRREGGIATIEPIKVIEADARGQFVIENLTQGTYKLSLNIFPFSENATKLPAVDQIVTVTGEGRHEVTFIVDLASKEKDN